MGRSGTGKPQEALAQAVINKCAIHIGLIIHIQVQDRCWPQYTKFADSHNEAGNDPGTERTMITAVNSAPLFGTTRTYAEGRCRFAFGMAALSAGTTMFFMGEEIGATNPFTADTFTSSKEDLIGQRTGAMVYMRNAGFFFV